MGEPSPQERMSNKNSLRSAFMCMISLGLATLGSGMEREVGDLGIQIAAPSSWETLSGKQESENPHLAIPPSQASGV